MIYRTPRVFRRPANVEAGSGANSRLTLSAGPLTASREGTRCRVRGSALVFHRPGPARYIELPGIGHFFFAENSDRLVGEIQEFLTGVREQGEPDRVLATVLFADIVGTTELAAKIGDRRWHVVLEAYYAAISRGTRTIPRK